MLELALTICLTANPVRCEERSLFFVDVSLIQCAVGAQQVLAAWSSENPGWRIDRYRCQLQDSRVTEA